MARGGSRPNAGRKRKSPELKLVTGTFRQDRDAKHNDDVPLGPMIAPLHLSDTARDSFAMIATMLEEQKRASPHYAEHVALLAQRLEQVAMCQSVLEIEGLILTSKAGGKRAHPAVAMLSDAMRHAQSLLGELMLNPAAALKIASGHKPEENAFSDF
jgi:P27 family predicted phage terminase small subunit